MWHERFDDTQMRRFVWERVLYQGCWRCGTRGNIFSISFWKKAGGKEDPCDWDLLLVANETGEVGHCVVLGAGKQMSRSQLLEPGTPFNLVLGNALIPNEFPACSHVPELRGNVFVCFRHVHCGMPICNVHRGPPLKLKSRRNNERNGGLSQNLLPSCADVRKSGSNPIRVRPSHFWRIKKLRVVWVRPMHCGTFSWCLC